MNHVLLVAVGGALGSIARYLTGLATLRWFGPNFPWGTLAVNILGEHQEEICRRFAGASSTRQNERRDRSA